MKTTVSRAVVAVSVTAALGLTAACGGGDGEGGDGRDGRDAGKPSTPQAQPKGPGGAGDDSAADGGSGSGGAENPEDRSPAARKLRAALVAKDDLRRYEVGPRERSKLEALSDGAPADPAACRPLSDMLAPATPPKARAHAGRTVGPKSLRAEDAATDVELFAYDSADDARAALRDLRSAATSKKCGAFRAGGARYSGVASRPAPDEGDESVAYKIGSRGESYVRRHSVVVVRDGSTLVSFAAKNFYDPQGVASEEKSRKGGGGTDFPGPAKADEEPVIPSAVMDAQLDKMA